VQSILLLRWRIAPAAVPRVLRHCPRCERERPFESSGRFRVNAQKKRLDAWLIYGCSVCGRTWNFPVFERKLVREVDPALLDRLHGNCAELAAERGSDFVALRRHVRGVDAVASQVTKEVVAGTRDPRLLRVEIGCGMPTLRLDRLLAVELRRSRSCIARWVERGVIVVTPAHRFVQDGQQVDLSLSHLPVEERQEIIRAAAGGEPT